MSSESGLIVHHLEDSRSQRILWLLEELEAPYTIKKYKRDKDRRAPPELIAIHPLGKSPIITDNGQVVAESGAIIEHLIRKYDTKGRFQPSESQWMTNTYYNHFAEGTFMSHIVFKYIMTLVPDHVPFFVRPLIKVICNTISNQAVQSNLERESQMVEAHLASLPLDSGFAGTPNKLTSADFMMFFPLETVLELDPKMMKDRKYSKAFVQRIHALPAFKKAIEKGGPYAYA